MEHRLSVDRQHVLHGLRLYRQLVRKADRTEDAILGFDGVCMTVEADGQMFFTQAFGAWPGNAYVRSTLIAALAKALPAGDPIPVTCDGKQLCFGRVTVGCRWEPISNALLDVPAARDWVRSLAISYTRSRGEIGAAGLADEVRAAQRQLGKVVKRVAKSLAPLGVSLADVRELVDRRLEEHYVSRS